MLWSLLSSAFVIYLYRKLAAEAEPRLADSQADDLGSALAHLNQRLASLDTRLASGKREEPLR